MDLYVGLAFDERGNDGAASLAGDGWVCGPRKLLGLLERHFGCGGREVNTEHLRAEQYRQILSGYLEEKGGEMVWFSASFAADPLATATIMLEMRDALVLGGWTADCGVEAGRLTTFAALERRVEMGRHAPGKQDIPALEIGEADRYREVIRLVEHRKMPFRTLWHHEPKELFPKHLRELFDAFQARGVRVRNMEQATPLTDGSDLARFQRALIEPGSRQDSFSGDGSLIIVRADRESDAALFLASFLRHNPGFRPTCVVPEKNRTLENALLQEGLPATGILSASLARPSLQILKLLPVFFWSPADPYKILEFLSLPTKPLHPELARQIGELIAGRPGMGSGRWKRVVRKFFEQLEESPLTDRQLRTIRGQYKRWFERTRVPQHGTVPRDEVIECFGYLANWARSAWEDNPTRHATFLALSSQAKRVCELLNSLPQSESELTPLQLERIIRTIYEPSPIEFSPAEAGGLSVIYEPGAIAAETDELVWWNFCRRDPGEVFSRWRREEMTALQTAGISIPLPALTNDAALWHSLQPVLRTRKRLILCIPAKINGEEVSPHALHDILEARFSNPDRITHTAGTIETSGLLSANFHLPPLEQITNTAPAPPTPWIQLTNQPKPDPERHEYVTQVSNLCYYPHQWVFRRHVGLVKSPILSVARDNTLNGNLGHRLLELLFKEEGVLNWDRPTLDQWIETTGHGLLPLEGSTLLMYGREPERRSFFRTLKSAAWTLLHHLNTNNWQVEAPEHSIEGTICSLPFRGRADLVLKRGEEHLIIDFKWRGFNYHRDMLRNEEDIQMALYSKFLGDPDKWAHTAYFMLQGGRMLAYNQEAISGAETPPTPASVHDVYPRIFEKITKTLQWRLDQFQDGFLEIRSSQTAKELDAYYGGALMEMLEMRDGDAGFDDYVTLVGGK